MSNLNPKQYTPETLPQITYKNIAVISTEILAELYKVKEDIIRRNHSRNPERFKEGKHYFKLEGVDLKEFKSRGSERPSPEISKFVKELKLWTEKGTALHAKLLTSNEAWDIYEEMVDFYFDRKEKKVSPAKNQSNHGGMLMGQAHQISTAARIINSATQEILAAKKKLKDELGIDLGFPVKKKSAAESFFFKVICGAGERGVTSRFLSDHTKTIFTEDLRNNTLSKLILEKEIRMKKIPGASGRLDTTYYPV